MMRQLSWHYEIASRLHRSATAALDANISPMARYALLDLLDVHFNNQFYPLNPLSAYGIPEHFLGQSWYSVEQYAQDVDPNRPESVWQAISVLYTPDPSERDVATLHNLIRRRAHWLFRPDLHSAEFAIPRILACQDIRRLHLLYPEDGSFEDFLRYAHLGVLLLSTKRPHLYITRFMTAIQAICCDANLDPIVRWNRVVYLGHILYHGLVYQTLLRTAPHQASSVLDALHHYLTFLSKEYFHEQFAVQPKIR